MPLTRQPSPAAGPSAGGTRCPGLLEAGLILLVLAGKISFWLPVPFVNINLSPLAFIFLFFVFLVSSFQFVKLKQSIASSFLLFSGLMIVLIALILAWALKENAFYGIGRLRLVIEMAAAIYIGAVIYIGDRRESFNTVMAWAGPIISIYFIYIFLLANDFNAGAALGTILETVRTGDPGAFTRAITFDIVLGTDEDADLEQFSRAMRHGWSSAILVAVLMSVLHHQHVGGGRLVGMVWLGFIGLSVLLLLALLSRGVLVGAAAGLLVSLVLPGRGKGMQFALLGGTTVVVGMVFIATGFTDLLYDQFVRNTDSYVARVDATQEAVRRITENILFGADESSYGISAHNWIVDLWQGAGIFAMLGGLLMIGYFGVEIARLILMPPDRLRMDRSQLLLAMAFVTAGTFVVIRFMTKGYGTIERHEALAAGLFIAYAVRLRLPVRVEDETVAKPPSSARSRFAERLRAHRERQRGEVVAADQRRMRSSSS